MTATTTEQAAALREGDPFTANNIDHRAEIAANEIEVVVTMPGGQTHHMKIDASRFSSAVEVADEVGHMLQRLLEA
jgi:hypothetical protein